MIKILEIKVFPDKVTDLSVLREKAAKLCKVVPEKINDIRILRRSIDARGSRPLFRLKIAVYIGEKYQLEPTLLSSFKKGTNQEKVLIVGAGPAGYFAALQLIELGIKPILFDRGKDVQARRRDLKAIQQFGIVNPHSNYCFGEGGAGTYSDGKLYTRSHKRGNVLKVLRLLVEHGATSDILIDAHPHIGSNKLPQIIANIRETILRFGGEIHFDSHVTDFITSKDKIDGIIVNQETEYFGDAVILATGHSARDIYELLSEKGVRLEAKGFALGVRVEHPQHLIDKIQYNQSPREPKLPAASYRLACQIGEKGVFSFCMCPGGLVVPAATAPGEIVLNGMSLSRRDSAYANSGVVTAVEAEDLQPYEDKGIFAGLHLQKKVEQKMFKAGDGSQKAPAQRLLDFVNGKISSNLPATSYIPGIFSAPVHELLPASIYNSLRGGFIRFGKIMKGYGTNEAVVMGTESRTSSPVRIPRNAARLMSDDLNGLFPCGEGAGFAGGILSAAMDGQNVGNAVANFLDKK